MSPRILAIDDTEHLRTVIRLTLQYKKFDVVLAADGVEGLEAAHGGAFDLIICDIEMPRLNGIEFVKQYRAEFGPATPIIMLTAEGDDKVKAARAAGANDALTKPFEPMQLFAVIDRHLKKEAI